MQWSPQQDAALKSVQDWLQHSDEQVFRLFGYAGTGKTTLAKHFAEGVSGLTLFGAFTGKAAYVLRQKGCVGAKTIHSLIYQGKYDANGMPLRDDDGNLIHEHNRSALDGVSPTQQREGCVSEQTAT